MDLQKGTFSHTKFDPFFWNLNLHIFLILAYNSLKFFTHITAVFGYIVTQKVT